MDFELSEDQVMLRDGLRALLRGSCDLDHVRASAYEGDGSDPGLWEELAAAGWPGLTVPEGHGGAGLGPEELMVVAMEAGACPLFLPLVTTLLAARAVAASPAPAREELLASLASGARTATLALSGSPDEWNREQPAAVATRSADGWVLNGRHDFVAFGPRADLCLMEARLPAGGPGLFVVPTDAAGLTWEDLGSMDPTVRRYRANLDGAELPASAALYGDDAADAAVEQATDELRFALAAESVGACGRMVQMTADYAKDREQFGRPIGSYQAVKVRVAQMASAFERMTAAVYYAALMLDADAEERTVAVRMAKGATAVPGTFVATQAIHVHGAIGYTWEHDLHFFMKRVKTNELLFGDGNASNRRIADAVL